MEDHYLNYLEARIVTLEESYKKYKLLEDTDNNEVNLMSTYYSAMAAGVFDCICEVKAAITIYKTLKQ